MILMSTHNIVFYGQNTVILSVFLTSCLDVHIVGIIAGQFYFQASTVSRRQIPVTGPCSLCYGDWYHLGTKVMEVFWR